MIRHALPFLLALSVLFNVFFVAGYVKAQNAVSTSVEPNVDLVANELSLDQQQRAVFKRLRSSLGEDELELRASIAFVEGEIRDELDGKHDPERMAQLLDRRGALHTQRRELASQRFGEFIGVLSPEQCRRISDRMERDGPRREHFQRRLMERFDTDRNGRLDESEKAAARAAMDQRHRERMERVRQYDLDGDGRLSADERAKMPEGMRRRGRGPGR